MLLNKLFNRQTKPNELGPRIIQVPRRQAGVLVNHDTALQSSAVYACVRVIAEDIAALPWHVFERKTDGSRERLITSPVEYVLNTRTNPDLGPFHFRETIIAHALIWGNGFAEITRDLAGRVSEMHIISPDRVEVTRAENGEVIYEINNVRGPNAYLTRRDVFHLHGIGFDGVVGYSLVSQAARSIGLTISVEEFGAAFFGNGATLGAVIKIPADSRLSDDAKKNVKETFNKEHKGSKKAHAVEVLDVGMEYQEIGVQPDKGQFLESRQHQVEEICRWFRVAPQKVAHLLRMTFNNVEQLSIDHVNDTLMPWISRLEDEANYKLFGIQNRTRYSKIITNALLRGDTEAKTKFYREMLNLGALSPNEIREFEDMNPIEGGEQYFMQMNMTTLEKIGEEKEEPAPTENVEETDIVPAIEDQIQNILLKEHKRFTDLATRYDRQDYVDRVCGHLGSQRIHITNDMTNTLTRVLTHIKADTSQAHAAAKMYAELHVEQSRKDAIALYDHQSVDIQARAHAMALNIKSAVIRYAQQHPAHNDFHDIKTQLENIHYELTKQEAPTINVNVEPPNINVDVNVDGVSKDKTVKMRRNDKGELTAEVIHLNHA